MVITRASPFPPGDEKSNSKEQQGGVVVGSNGIIISACFVGLLTGLSVVLFNYLVRYICLYI